MSGSPVTAYPLSWPVTRKRTSAFNRRSANFHRRVSQEGGWKRKTGLTVADSRDRLLSELESLGGSKIIISTNLQLLNNGLPRSTQREPDDPGAAVYFEMIRQPHCLSCDVWDRCADNLAAIAKHIEAMRGQLRWGVADVATMFSGFKALPGPIVTPAPMTVEEAARFILSHAPDSGYGIDGILKSRDGFKSVYREAARKLHADPNGGVARPEWNNLQDAAAVLRSHHQI